MNEVHTPTVLPVGGSLPAAGKGTHQEDCSRPGAVHSTGENV